MTTSRKQDQSAALGWFKTYPSIEDNILRFANARQIALRMKLRHAYWLGQCAPLTDQRIRLEAEWMGRVDPRDKLEEDELKGLLTPEYGFERNGNGWSIPDLEAAYQEAAEAFRKKQASASLGGKRSAETRRQAARSKTEASAPPPALRPVSEPPSVPPSVSRDGDF